MSAPETTPSPEALVKRRHKRDNLQNFGQEYAEPGDNSAFMRHAMVAWDMPPIDISDPEQVEARAKEYFSYCIENDCKPNKATLCCWLGIDRTTLHSWTRGEWRSATHKQLAKKIDSLMQSILVEMMINNKVNPASGIFLLKNFDGYRDQIDIAPAVPNPLGDMPDPEALRKKIEANVTED